MHAYTPTNSIFDGPVTNLLSVLCVSVEVLAHAKRGKSLNDFKFGPSNSSTGRFLSDGAASTAVKGLTECQLPGTEDHRLKRRECGVQQKRTDFLITIVYFLN